MTDPYRPVPPPIPNDRPVWVYAAAGLWRAICVASFGVTFFVASSPMVLNRTLLQALIDAGRRARGAEEIDRNGQWHILGQELTGAWETTLVVSFIAWAFTLPALAIVTLHSVNP